MRGGVLYNGVPASEHLKYVFVCSLLREINSESVVVHVQNIYLPTVIPAFRYGVLYKATNIFQKVKNVKRHCVVRK